MQSVPIDELRVGSVESSRSSISFSAVGLGSLSELNMTFSAAAAVSLWKPLLTKDDNLRHSIDIIFILKAAILVQIR